MRAGEILQLWERAGHLGPVERALALAEAAGADSATLRSQPVGATNAQVLVLRESMLRDDLSATATCPGCGLRVEFSLDPGVLRGAASSADGGSRPAGECVVRWRLPTPQDLLDVAGMPDPESALRRRCVGASTAAGEEVDLDALSPAQLEVVDAVEAEMALADPLAEVLVALECPDCERLFEADVDLGGFVWAEVDARARRVLHEVDVLARAYGWTEPEVLALGEARRAAYLRLVLDGAP